MGIRAIPELAQILTSTLNPDTNTRIQAELKLADLLKEPRMPDYVHTRSIRVPNHRAWQRTRYP